MAGVFISYSPEDVKVAKKLARDLKQHGVSAWLDRAQLAGGDPTAPQIQEGLQESDRLLVLVSEESAGSKWVEQALEPGLLLGAAEIAGAIVPIRLDSALPPARLAEVPHVDFRNGYDEGLADLLRLLGARIPPSHQLTDVIDAEILAKGLAAEARLSRPKALLLSIAIASGTVLVFGALAIKKYETAKELWDFLGRLLGFK